MGMRKQIPESWDRYEVIRFIEERIIIERFKTIKPHYLRVTSVEETDDFGKHYIYVRYQVKLTTKRFELPKPDEYITIYDILPGTMMFDFNLIESHMKTYMRDEKLKKIFDDDV